MDLDKIYESAAAYISLYGLKVIAAIAIFIIGKWVAKRVVNVLKKVMKKASVDETLISFAGNIFYGLGLAFVVIASLSQLGVETTSLAAVIAAAGLAIGLALQGSLSNLAAGVMIILFRPFKIGDFVEAAGAAGIVEDISIFTTKFRTPDNRQIIVPNNAVTSDNITNISAKPERRVDLVIGVGYDDDLKKVKDVLSKIVSADERVLKDKDVVIAVSELADSSVNLVVRPWVKTEDYWPVYWDLTEQIKVTFDKEGISIPYPQRDLHVIDGGAVTTKKAA
ncbi:MAG: mechanosensitive ion channel domain-containing protein [Pseudomonadota bacterium]|nr:mechanosensitive ion channel domain-containing protein [Pseudomonadota bacterium]MEC9236999.1 mechanosensitive ion channel domain-containing protein [Pseudomonadota bacterium]